MAPLVTRVARRFFCHNATGRPYRQSLDAVGVAG